MRLLNVKDSDIIDAIGFTITDARPTGGAFGTLGVVFKGSEGYVYEYKGVFVDTFAKLVDAESIGKLFHELFKKTKYPFTKSTRPSLQK